MSKIVHFSDFNKEGLSQEVSFETSKGHIVVTKLNYAEKDVIDMLFLELYNLRKEVSELKRINKIREVSDEDAAVEIKKYLKEQKCKGISKIYLLDLIDELRLPTEQIERIMSSLESLGVKEVE